MTQAEDKCPVKNCVSVPALSYNVNGTKLSPCQTHWEQHCDKVIDLRLYCMPGNVK